MVFSRNFYSISTLAATAFHAICFCCMLHSKMLRFETMHVTALQTPSIGRKSMGARKSSVNLENPSLDKKISADLSRRGVLSCILGSGVMVARYNDLAFAFDFSVPGSGSYVNAARKIRKVCVIMDELQRDLQQERWDLVEAYPAQLRSYVPIFTAYTDEAFFSDDQPSNKSLRVALRYEVGRLFGSLERLKQATARKDLNEAYLAYSMMAIHFDRYLKSGNLYTYTDPLVSTEPLFENVSDDALIYSNPKRDPPEVRDLVVMCKGPDKGKTGIVIGIFPDTKNVVVKLDRFRKDSPIREIKVVSPLWAAKRLGEQDPDEVFLISRKQKK